MSVSMYVCHTCGKQFKAAQLAKYCSPACKQVVRNHEKATFQCVYCGKAFVGNKLSKPKFCSKACISKCRKEITDNPDSPLSRYMNVSRKEKPVYKRVCIVCGNYFETRNPSNVNRCCESCAKDYGKRWYREVKEAQKRGYLAETSMDQLLSIKGVDPESLESVPCPTKRQTPSCAMTREESNARRRLLRRKKAALGLGAEQASGPKTMERLKLLEERGTHCEVCGWDTDQDALQVHHIDADRTHNEQENLIVLCANCHAILHMRVKRNWTKELSKDDNCFKLELTKLRAETKERNEAGKPDRATRTEGCEGSQSGATHSGTPGPGMSHQEAVRSDEDQKIC